MPMPCLYQMGRQHVWEKMHLPCTYHAYTMHIPCIYKCMTYQVGLLNVSETLRVGCTPEGFLGIYSHPWFAEIDWQVSSK